MTFSDRDNAPGRYSAGSWFFIIHSAKNSYVVTDSHFSPALSTVLGNSGWFGESG